MLSSDEILGSSPPFQAASLCLLQLLAQSRPRLQFLKVELSQEKIFHFSPLPQALALVVTVRSSQGRPAHAWPRTGLWKGLGCLEGRWDLLTCFSKSLSRTLHCINTFCMLQHTNAL